MHARARTTAWLEIMAWLEMMMLSTFRGEMSNYFSFCFSRKHPSFWVIKVPGVFITSCIRIHVKKVSVRIGEVAWQCERYYMTGLGSGRVNFSVRLGIQNWSGRRTYLWCRRVVWGFIPYLYDKIRSTYYVVTVQWFRVQRFRGLEPLIREF